ncbi:unnamed protein product (macronuclear) [Paramecium tetraurelia]|uniref:Uncharacterized protein n=1 Tax=Paramecium tetraurelia TaxID=5888 RepID=A0BVC8_PARTE|nr:uncharacterized protein GSPATT00005741001 [Paramecium tetraurelia]CAK62495.1 unnamed protein product [Paramecium tetraurelia]|eukprot:XP_001429893.1 hypothetical protein (macronuclear) [Paramecium tetraurelia strain d4-2]
MQEDLNSSLDSLELDLYHRPNPQIKAILNFLRSKNLKFCTDPRKKEEDYYSKMDNMEDNKDLGLVRNKFFKRNNKHFVCETKQ